jgi:hypothetical protein
VWVRKGVATTVCPKSYISGDSMAWLEAFEMWKRIGHGDPKGLGARQMEAMLLLEQELSAEIKRGDE